MIGAFSLPARCGIRDGARQRSHDTDSREASGQMDALRSFEWERLVAGDMSWAAQIFAAVLAILLLNFFLLRLLDRVHATLTKTANPWDDAFVEALRLPLRVFVWLAGLTFVVHIVESQTEGASAFFSSLDPVLDVGIIAVFVWFLMRLVERVEENLIQMMEAAGRSVDRTTADALAKLVRASVVIAAALVIMQTLGFSIAGLLAFGGIGGIAIGFAAKDLLANFLGGLILFFDRPFVVGDWIRSPDREIEGTVEEIGWRQTKIRTFDKRPLYVPNGFFLSMAIENPSRMSHRRIKETIGVRYDDLDKMDAITAEVRQMLIGHPEIDESQTLMVNFNAFAPSSLDFFIYTFTHTTVWTDFHVIKQDVLLKIGKIIAAHGAEIAFPTSTVHVPERVRIQEEPGAAG
jgi:MscS family membrane protein